MIHEYYLMALAIGICFSIAGIAIVIHFNIWDHCSFFMSVAIMLAGSFALSSAITFGVWSARTEDRNIAISRCIESGWYPENYCRTGTNRVQKEFAFPLEDLKLASANCMKSQYSKKEICTSQEFFDVETIISAFGPEPTMVVCGRANDKFCQKD